MKFATYINIAYLISAICFIYGLKMLSHPRTARNGNFISSFGMLIAILATLSFGIEGGTIEMDWKLIFIALGMRREAFPAVDFDQVIIRTIYPGANPENVEKHVGHR